MFHFFRKPPESKKPSVPETEADGFTFLVYQFGCVLQVQFIKSSHFFYPVSDSSQQLSSQQLRRN
ncbi:hypothetical protein FD755_012501 [Muntiacus reevesi]|uniref:Uncharacterized protein n=1 Tax=Muntiacus reevesi TaxID=9886 RepID=A0A5N3XQE0_MUNRE|nr:hypothetical protein FD755_012501 [Muntiacus reevesi]